MTSLKNSNPESVLASASRREFLTIASVAGGIGILGAANLASSANKRNELPIELAGYDYDRVQALIDGRVGIDGCKTQFEISRIGEMNSHAISGPQTREVTEIGLHPFMLAYANDDFRAYTLIPVFPLRVFRHKSIFIRTDRGIETPGDLRGKKIGVAGYSSTSLTWIRGMLADDYDVKPADVQWVIASKDSSAKAAGASSRQENVVPPGISMMEGPPGQDESDLLESGAVDALFHAAEPRAYIEGHPSVARLFPDSRASEHAYFSRTGIFPIMHAVAIRKDVLKTYPWLAEAVFNAYSQSKQRTYDYLSSSAWYKTSLPWVSQELEATRALMGKNYWPYGIEPNRKALTTLFRYSYEQGLSSRELTIEELFHPASLDLIESWT